MVVRTDRSEGRVDAGPHSYAELARRLRADMEANDAPWDVTRRAADRAGVSIRHLTRPSDVDRVMAVIESVWGDQAMPRALLRAFQHAGSCFLGAETGGEVIGFVLGFMGSAEGPHLHSHMLAVRPEARSAGIGFALKLAQRAAAIDEAIEEIRWTYDPLIARNARFNLSRLGAVATAYFENFYGDMPDRLNRGDRSDRFEVRWRLRSAWVERVLRSGAPGVDLAGRGSILGAGGPRDAPRPVETGERPANGVIASIPPDYQALRERDPDLAREWREASGRAFAACFDGGLVARTFDGGAYRFQPSEEPHLAE
ncbi:MAG: GNAT family N-acetyltransferase [Actinobacteria bacterium]|nr:MAG: GNAT family N-acetyltransferase [Actinomycetota bacterium]